MRLVAAAAPDLGAEVTGDELDAHVRQLTEEQLDAALDVLAMTKAPTT